MMRGLWLVCDDQCANKQMFVVKVGSEGKEAFRRPLRTSCGTHTASQTSRWSMYLFLYLTSTSDAQWASLTWCCPSAVPLFGWGCAETSVLKSGPVRFLALQGLRPRPRPVHNFQKRKKNRTKTAKYRRPRSFAVSDRSFFKKNILSR